MRNREIPRAMSLIGLNPYESKNRHRGAEAQRKKDKVGWINAEANDEREARAFH
jgi:hypothetical protein